MNEQEISYEGYWIKKKLKNFINKKYFDDIFY